MSWTDAAYIAVVAKYSKHERWRISSLRAQHQWALHHISQVEKQCQKVQSYILTPVWNPVALDATNHIVPGEYNSLGMIISLPNSLPQIERLFNLQILSLKGIRQMAADKNQCIRLIFFLLIFHYLPKSQPILDLEGAIQHLNTMRDSCFHWHRVC